MVNPRFKECSISWRWINTMPFGSYHPSSWYTFSLHLNMESFDEEGAAQDILIHLHYLAWTSDVRNVQTWESTVPFWIVSGVRRCQTDGWFGYRFFISRWTWDLLMKYTCQTRRFLVIRSIWLNVPDNQARLNTVPFWIVSGVCKMPDRWLSSLPCFYILSGSVPIAKRY